MPDEKIDEVLSELKQLKSWLYGANGHAGDIPEIKACFKDHDKRIRRIEVVLVGLIVAGGGAAGVIKLFSG